VRKRTLIAFLVAATAFATVFALAASLSVSPTDLGAGNASVASCDTDGVSTSYTNAWDSTDKRYEVTSVTITGIADACDGKTAKVALADSSNASLGDGSTTIPTGAGTTATVSSLSSNPAASAVANANVVIGD
jgi:hypothetical protein